MKYIAVLDTDEIEDFAFFEDGKEKYLHGIDANSVNGEWIYLPFKPLEQEPRKGEWLRMSDLSEQEDDRYKCSRCGNVIHYKNKMDLYTFNSWCGRCGSDNGRNINYEVEE